MNEELEKIIKKDFRVKLWEYLVPLIGDMLYEERNKKKLENIMRKEYYSLIEKSYLLKQIDKKRIRVAGINLVAALIEISTCYAGIVYYSDKILYYGNKIYQVAEKFNDFIL